jgi:hypothetical protein
MTEPLPALLDCRGLMEELGVKRATAEAIMRRIPIVTVPDCRRVFVKRADVEQALRSWTLEKTR